MHDVIIVGAGPAGLRCAHLCRKAGLDAIVLDRKQSIGRPIQCSGLISRNLDRFVDVPKDCIEHEVRGAVIHGPDGREIRLEKPGSAAYVLDREKFDVFMAGQAGSDIFLEHDVRDISINSSGVALSTSKGSFRSMALIGCDGPGSVVRKHFGENPADMLNGIIAIIDQTDESEFVELWLDRSVCDGFLWRIPRGSSVEYGMLGSVVKYQQLEKFFKLKPGYRKHAGLIPIGGCKSYFQRTLLVGDAAAQTKPWSGGGVIYGLICAGHAVKTLSKAIDKGDLSEQALKPYEDAWRSELSKPISMGMMARQLYKDIDTKQFSEMFGKLASRDLNSLDMDFPAFCF